MAPRPGLLNFGLLIALLMPLLASGVVHAEENDNLSPTPPSAPTSPSAPSGAAGTDPKPLEIKIGEENGPRISSSISMLLTMTALSFLPALLMMTTAFARIVIVLGFLRQALATQQTPPNVIIIGISLFLTMFIMGPVFQRMNQDAIDPYLKGTIQQEEALQKGLKPLRTFMGHQTRKKDLALMLDLSQAKAPENFDDVPTTTLIPAFIISELRTAFQMGFLLFLPFLIIDLVVASVLMSFGMIMLPPAMVSLPLKLLLFVLADGWYLIVKSLAASFAAAG